MRLETPSPTHLCKAASAAARKAHPHSPPPAEPRAQAARRQDVRPGPAGARKSAPLTSAGSPRRREPRPGRSPARLSLAPAAALLLGALSPFAPTPAGAQTPIWSATLTADESAGFFGCDNDDATQDNCSTATVLTDDDFTYQGRTYTVTKFYWGSSRNKLTFGGFEGIAGSAARRLLSGLTLNVQGNAFAISDAQTSTSTVFWSYEPATDWTDGLAVSVSLTRSPTVAVSTPTPVPARTPPGALRNFKLEPNVSGELFPVFTHPGGTITDYDLHYTIAPKTGAGAVGDTDAASGTNPAQGWVAHRFIRSWVGGLVDGTEYRFRMRAGNAHGSGPWTYATGTPQARMPEKPPTGLRIPRPWESVRLKWWQPTALMPAGYDVHYTSAPKTGTGAVGDTDAASGTDPAKGWVNAGPRGTGSRVDGEGGFSFHPHVLTHGTQYRFRVRAVYGQRTGVWRNLRTPVPGGWALVSTVVGAGVELLAGPRPICYDYPGPACDRPIRVYEEPPAHSPTLRIDRSAPIGFSLSHAVSYEVSVDYATSSSRSWTGTAATAGTDYTSVSGTVTFAPGETRKTIYVPILDDNHEDSHEGFVVEFSNPSPLPAVRLASTAAWVVILNHDTGPMPPTFLPASGATVTDAAGDITLTFAGPIRKDSAGTGFEDGDLSSILTLKADGENGSAIGFTASINAQKTVITIDPSSDLPHGQVYVAVSDAYHDAAGNRQGSAANATFTVAREARAAVAVSLSAAPNPVGEGSAATVTATLAQALAEAVTVPLTVTRGTSEDDDHGSLASITIPAGGTSATGTISTSTDTDGDDETFTVALGSLPSGLTAGTTSSVEITITDNGAAAAARGAADAERAVGSHEHRRLDLRRHAESRHVRSRHHDLHRNGGARHHPREADADGERIRDDGARWARGRASRRSTSGSASAAIALVVGANALKVQVSAADGTAETYTVTVTREARVLSADAALSALIGRSRRSRELVGVGGRDVRGGDDGLCGDGALRDDARPIDRDGRACRGELEGGRRLVARGGGVREPKHCDLARRGRQHAHGAGDGGGRHEEDVHGVGHPGGGATAHRDVRERPIGAHGGSVQLRPGLERHTERRQPPGGGLVQGRAGDGERQRVGDAVHRDGDPEGGQRLEGRDGHASPAGGLLRCRERFAPPTGGRSRTACRGPSRARCASGSPAQRSRRPLGPRSTSR